MSISDFNGTTAAILTALVGVYPFFRVRNRQTALFAASNLCLAAWNLTDYVMVLHLDPATQLFLFRFGSTAAILVVLFLFEFVLVFSQVDMARFQKTRRVLQVLGAGLMVLNFTPWIIADLRQNVHPHEVPGPLFPLLMSFMLFTLGFTLLTLYREYKDAEGHKRKQFKYMFLALSFGFLEAPLFFIDAYTTKIASFYYYLQVAYSITVAYAILAHRLLDITVLVRRTAVYSVATGLLTGIYLLIATQLAKVLEGASGQGGFWASAVAALAITLLFNPLMDKVRRLMDEKFFGNWLQDLSRGVVHEVKRPLASISMPAQLTLLELEDIEKGVRSFESVLPEFKRRMQGIVQKTTEAADCIEALYAVTDSNNQPSQPVQVGAVIEKSLSGLARLMEECPVEVRMERSETISPVKGDSRQLEIVFKNIIKNAIEAMEPVKERHLRVKIEEDKKWVTISVRDSGPGLKSMEKDQLFNAHFSTKSSKGMGLGLYLSKRIIAEHNGSIDVHAEDGQGTEFVVRLPKFVATAGIQAA